MCRFQLECALFKIARGVLLDEELLTKSPRLAQSKARAKHTLPEIEDQSPPASEPGSKTFRSLNIYLLKSDGVPATKDARAIRKFKFPKRPVNKCEYIKTSE